MNCLNKIISGGQTGADRAGLIAAKELGLETGGWVPKGYKTEVGSDWTLREFNLIETASAEYPARTEMNIVHSDGTLIFGKDSERGTALTVKLIHKHQKPLFTIVWPRSPYNSDMFQKSFCKWLFDNNIQVLNVAGNRESKNPGIFEACKKFLIESLRNQS